MMERRQGEAIAALMSALRADWDYPGCFAAIGAVKDRDAHDVAIAAVRLAATKEAKTPGALKVDGPHWREKVVATFSRPDTPFEQCCELCSKPEPVCVAQQHMWHPDDRHPFLSVEDARRARYNAGLDPYDSRGMDGREIVRQRLHEARDGMCVHNVKREHCKDPHREYATTEPQPAQEDQ